MNNLMTSAFGAIAALGAAMSVTVAAQSGGTMGKTGSMAKMDTMNKPGASMTYTGCLEAGNVPGTFKLVEASHVDHDAMKHESTKNDAMPQTSMTQDSMKRDSMKPGSMKDGMADATGHDMASTTLSVASTSVGLSQHVGHKVSVTGSQSSTRKNANGTDGATFTVKTLKMVAPSCQ